MVAGTVVGGGEHPASLMCGEHALDGARVEVRAVGEDDERVRHLRSESREPGTERRARPALPMLRSDEGNSRP